MKNILILVSALTVCGGSALAAQDLHSLQQGVRIRVQLVEGSSGVGSLVGVSNDSLVLLQERTRSSPRSYALVGIRAVDVSRGRRRGLGALVGALEGFAIGATLGGGVSAMTCHDSFFCRSRGAAAAFGAMMGGVPGILLGSIYGVIQGRDDWERVELSQH